MDPRARTWRGAGPEGLLFPHDPPQVALKKRTSTRCIAARRTDGGTAFTIELAPHRFTAELRSLLALLQQETAPELDAQRRREGWYVKLPAGHPLYFERLPVARASVDGRHSQRIVLHVEDRCYVQLSERPNPDTGEVRWRVRVEAKARELYADGLASWVETWLGAWSWMLGFGWLAPEELRAAGWATSQWHVNSDFVGLDLADEDVRRFVGVRKVRSLGKSETLRELKRNGVIATSQGTASSLWVQTFELGRRASDTQLVIYRKSDQLREAKTVDPQASMYADLWEANGYDPDEDGDVTRVEARLRKKGLQYIDPSTRKPGLDFRDPALLLDEQAVAQLWRHVMTNRRLVEVDRTRIHRGRTDPVWRVVQRAGTVEDAEAMRQLPRDVRDMTRDERLAKDMREAVLAGIKYAARHGVAARTLGDAGASLKVLGDRLLREVPAELAALPHGIDTNAAADRATATSEFFADAAASASDDFRRLLADAARRDPASFELLFPTKPEPN